MIKLYNTLKRKKEQFNTIEPGVVRMYTCGPTVYYYPHIGNMRAYIFMDTLRRTLKYNGYKINGVMNITDVGHLTSDSDDGEDKMEKASKREHKSPWEIAKYYTDVFFGDLQLLNIDVPEHITKATEYIPQMIKFIQKLEAKGYTYIIDDGVYFDVSKFAGYGQLSHKDMDEVGVARVESSDQKHHPYDFALWKFVPDSHIMKWDSPWGVGCPGWHIECSAMSNDILGEHIDIHTGGIDHLPIHHENEIAQNDCAMGHQVVNYWLHNEFVLVDGGKMSKSLNNIYTIKQLMEMGYSPLAYKYFVLNSNYTKKINFTVESLKSAQASLTTLHKLLAEHKESKVGTDKQVLDKYHGEFVDAVNDNLNTPLALGILFSMLKNEKPSIDLYNLALDFDRVFGLRLDEEIKQDVQVPQDVKELAEKRWQAKLAKDWATADAMRAKLAELGYEVKDGKDGYEITKK